MQHEPNYINQRQTKDEPKAVRKIKIWVANILFFLASAKAVLSISSDANGPPPPSTTETTMLERITNVLTTGEEIIIGVYGSSNRTNNVVRQIKRIVERDNVFDVAVTAKVVYKNNNLLSRARGSSTRSPDVRKIQRELAKELNLQLDDKASVVERATRLHAEIRTRRRILIILQDLEGGINLGEIGIPTHHGGCKIMLLAQTEEVLLNQMNAPHIQFCPDY